MTTREQIIMLDICSVKPAGNWRVVFSPGGAFVHVLNFKCFDNKIKSQFATRRRKPIISKTPAGHIPCGIAPIMDF